MNNLLYSNKSQKRSYAIQVLCVKVFNPSSVISSVIASCSSINA